MERRSIADTRALLGVDADGLSDDQVRELRDGMYAFVELFVGVPARVQATRLRQQVMYPRRPRRARAAVKRSA